MNAKPGKQKPWLHSTWNIKQSQILSRSEIAAVLSDLDRWNRRRSVNSRQNRVVFRLATCVGLRASEIAGLKMLHVRLGVKRPYIRIPAEIGKGSKSREVPLTWDRGTLDDLITWKDERREKQGARPGDPFVCCQRKTDFGSPLDRWNVRKRFKTACKVLGPDRLPDLTVHSGRHSFVSHALAGGRSLAAVRDAVGHSNIATTSIYTHVVVDDDEDVGELFAFNE